MTDEYKKLRDDLFGREIRRMIEERIRECEILSKLSTGELIAEICENGKIILTPNARDEQKKKCDLV